MSEISFLGVGLYSIPEASRLAHIHVQRVRRWVKGYTYFVGEDRRASPPVWPRQLPDVDGQVVLTFRDLMEVRFVDAFRNRGVSWKSIRAAAEKARIVFDTPHPFSHKRFKTDGKTIFAEIESISGELALLDLVKDQYAFQRVVEPFLLGVEFGAGDHPRLWRPKEGKNLVVIDPARCFGQPIVAKENVPTVVLARAYHVEKDARRVAAWFEVSLRSVEIAVEFERNLAA
jgi:uncharacterized protein (DUF433 family)